MLLAHLGQGDSLAGVGGRRLSPEDGRQLLVQSDQAVALLELSQDDLAEGGVRGSDSRARRLDFLAAA
jgi:hypothetical protein